MTLLSHNQCAGMVICLNVLMLHTTALTTAQAGEQEREAFLRQYQPYAEKLQRDYENIKIRYQDTYDLGNGRMQISEMEGKYNISNGSLEGEIKTMDSNKADAPVKTYRRVECYNVHYSFTLTPDSGNQYKIDRLRFGKTGTLCFFLAPCAEYQRGQTFLEMAQDPSIPFISFSDGKWQDKLMKELKVKFKRKFLDSKNEIEMNPSYFFSPEEGWICHGARYDTSDPNIVYEKRYSFAPKNGERYPDLKSIEGWFVNVKNSSDSHRKHLTKIIEYVHSAPFSESEFALSAFGLPDPIDAPPPPQSRVWLWLLVAAISASGIALFFAWLKRRRRMITNTQLSRPISRSLS